MSKLFQPGTMSHKAGLALLTAGLLAGSLSSGYASFKALQTPGRGVSQIVLGWLLGAVGVLLLGFAAYFGNSLFKSISEAMEARRRSRLRDTVTF